MKKKPKELGQKKENISFATEARAKSEGSMLEMRVRATSDGVAQITYMYGSNYSGFHGEECVWTEFRSNYQLSTKIIMSVMSNFMVT